MRRTKNSTDLSRRKFAAGLTGIGAAAPLLAQQASGNAVAKQAEKKAPQNANASPQNTSTAPRRRERPPERPPFGETIDFKRNVLPPKVEAFRMQEIRLLPGSFKQAQDANLAYLKRLDPDRLLHNFRVNAGLPSSAKPLGGWEAPDCELRGHFVGHFLSACALMYASNGDNALKDKAGYVVAELAKCQAKLGGGYLSAFPLEFFDRLNARQKVWAPFYTIHKIMAGMFDMHEHCGNQQALEVLEGMANWVDHWSGPIPEPHMQDILNTEYGGMNEVLYNLAGVTGENRYAVVGDRFTKKKFFNPLGLRRDELRGLHVNTHIPQVIGAARRYEISGDERFHDVADFFWYEVTSARAYVTGGTSNGEAWLVEPRRLGAELKLTPNTTECCCAYNMLKLTRHLYRWTADPRYFDYYERTLLNHRLGAINLENGHTQYYLSIVPAAWRTFNTEDDSFWCCTGTGVEEFSKLNNSIYFHDNDGLYVNLFAPSELDWKQKGIRVRQETKFPESTEVTFSIHTSAPVQMPIHFRIPSWAGAAASVQLNERPVDVVPSPGSYLTISRTWKNGDRIGLQLPMYLHVVAMPDEPTTQALLYGPLVLAGKLGSDGLAPDSIVGPMGPEIEKHPLSVPQFRATGATPDSWIKQNSRDPLSFRTVGQQVDVSLVPFNRVPEERYSIYWTVS
ncbi:MAG: glycoside hydrolase family 127 protein [Acidobacteriaceae bacterium]|nr:glycoside hydrolase family 127 protein [Acidobacteriaceae bacterium]